MRYGAANFILCDSLLGFDSIGSAILIAYDGVPVLTTDAWINDDAYFGSWGHDYAIPVEQMDAIGKAKFHWLSHGHPDHLNVESLPQLTRPASYFRSSRRTHSP
jgi:L-ascorbate metabolism protein UlaG (beta-lactamase superfamily)